jgi:hypothetical protein
MGRSYCSGTLCISRHCGGGGDAQREQTDLDVVVRECAHGPVLKYTDVRFIGCCSEQFDTQLAKRKKFMSPLADLKEGAIHWIKKAY